MNEDAKWNRFTKRFWKSVEKMPSGCWHWTKSVRSEKMPYGKLMFVWNGARIQLAHRAAWLLTHGELPTDKHVLHKCDNPRCVNPDHLFLGTQKDNVQDAVSKNRMKGQPGEKNCKAKLTAKQVKEIRALAKKGNANSLAKKFSVTSTTIHDIVSRKHWNHV